MASDLARDVAAVRRFNRFYTREVGVLRKTFLDTPYSLGEARILYEIRKQPGVTAKEIGRTLDLDAAHLSRLISRFEKQRLLTRAAAAADARHYELTLTPRGRAAVDAIDVRQAAATEATLAALSAAERKQLTAAMHTIETLLDRERART